MRKQIIALCVGMGFMASSALAQYDANPHLSALDGSAVIGTSATFRSGVLQGRSALVMFWAANCPPCLVEMQGFTRLKAAANGTPIIVIVERYGAREQGLLANPRNNGALILNVGGNYRALLEEFGDTEAALPYSILMGKTGSACIAHLGLMNPRAINDMQAECD